MPTRLTLNAVVLWLDDRLQTTLQIALPTALPTAMPTAPLTVMPTAPPMWMLLLHLLYPMTTTPSLRQFLVTLLWTLHGLTHGWNQQ
jgi:hypothetical protein